MSSTPKLFVPMHLEALVVSNPKKEFLDLSPRIDQFSASILGNVIQPDTKEKITLEKGIHLHWTLPKALKNIFINEKGESNFPYVPNRWMVIRIQTNKGISNMQSRTWIINSDEENDLKDSATPPNWAEIKNNKLNFKSLGKTSEWSKNYEDKSTQSTFEPILTAVGAVNHNFASIYNSSKNVFAFHDDLKNPDVENNAIFTYVVTGWYSDPSLDPLHALRPLLQDFEQAATKDEQDDQKEKMFVQNWFKENWSLKDKGEEKEYPTSCMLHSSIHSVQWKENTKSGVPEGNVVVYAGNTAIEGLSTQIINSKDESQEGIEELLNALQYQLLEDSGNEPDFATLKTEIHKRGFLPMNRGIYWEINRMEEKDDKNEKKANFPQNPQTRDLILKDLKELNTNQILLNKINQEIYSLQQEYYFLWSKEFKMLLTSLENINFKDEQEKIEKQITSSKVSGANLLELIKEKKGHLNEYKELAGENPEFQLQQKLEDRFWEPNDIVLLLCGDGVGDTNKPIFQTQDKKVTCRIHSDLLTKLELNVLFGNPDISGSISTSIFKVPEVSELVNDKIPFEEITSLVYETLFLDHSLSQDIASAAFREAQKAQDEESIKDFAKDVIIKYQQSVVDDKTDKKGKNVGDDNKSRKLLEGFSIIKWKQAWTPLYMVWEVEYTPITPEIKDLDLFGSSDSWKLEEGLYYKSKLTTGGQSISVNGISPFSNSVFENLKNGIPKDIIEKYGELNLISQSLSGLHKFLIMQRPDIQLPPFEYKEDKAYKFSTNYSIDKKVLSIIGDEGYRLGCEPGNLRPESKDLFHPLRSGYIQIKRLSIADVFGQEKIIFPKKDRSNEIINCSNTLNKEAEVEKNKIPLPPRILQPARIQFNWLNELDSILFQDTGEKDSPVLAWLVPNYLDNSIMVYDGKGNEVIVLQITSDITKGKGLKLSKKRFPGSGSDISLSEGSPLKRILDSFEEEQGSIVKGIMDLALKVNGKLIGNQALQNNTSSLLCGQPLALVRCSIRLELLGLPYYNQQWSKSGMQNTGDIETVKFPLMVGNFKMQKDGLLGYFLDPEEAVTKDPKANSFYTVMNAPDFKFSDEVFFKKNEVLKLSIEREPLKINLLMNPAAGVHLTTGILPTKFVEMFNHSTNEILSRLDIQFMTAPFIAEKINPGIPVPSGINGNWKWTHMPGINTWQNNQAVPEGKNKQIQSFSKKQLYEGWLKLSHLKEKNNIENL